MQLRPYFSIDIETTGLNLNKSQVLEIGIIYDDGVSPLTDLPNLRLVVKPFTDYYEPYAMSMHSNLLKEVVKAPLRDACNITGLIRDFMEISKGLPTLAGKNVAGFDLPILRANGIDIKANHRVIDVGSVFFAKFGYVPSLDEINKLIGLPKVAHTALDDALNVVRAIRAIKLDI